MYVYLATATTTTTQYNCSKSNSTECDTYNNKYANDERANERKGRVWTSPHFRQHCEASFSFKFNLPATQQLQHLSHMYECTHLCMYLKHAVCTRLACGDFVAYFQAALLNSRIDVHATWQMTLHIRTNDKFVCNVRFFSICWQRVLVCRS